MLICNKKININNSLFDICHAHSALILSWMEMYANIPPKSTLEGMMSDENSELAAGNISSVIVLDTVANTVTNISPRAVHLTADDPGEIE